MRNPFTSSVLLPPLSGRTRLSSFLTTNGPRAFLSWLAMVGLLAGTAQANVRRVWAVNDGEKIERDARDHPASAGNSAWDGRVVRVSGARNEVVAFQVIVEADAQGIAKLSVRAAGTGVLPGSNHLPACSRRSDRLRRSADRDLHGALHARRHALERVVGVRTRLSGGTLRSRPDGSRCSSCRRMRAQAAADCRSQSMPTRIRRSGSRSTSIAPVSPVSIAARSRSTPMGRDAPSRSSSRCSTSRCRTRTACTRCCSTRAISPSSITAAISTPPTTASRTGIAWSWCTRTTSRRCPRPGDDSPVKTSRAAHGYEGPGEGVGNRARAAYVLRRRARVRGSLERMGTQRCLDDVPPREAAARDHVPLHAGRAEPVRISRTS